jgi:hypothetical protein
MPYINYNVFHTTGYVESMARRGHWHDTFSCPHFD